MSDKNFLNEIIRIIKKYFPQLERMISELMDKRHKSYITYNMKTIIFTKLIALICGITTMTGINDNFNTEKAIENLSIICGQTLKEVPDWQTIQDVIEQLKYEKINEIRQYIFKALIRSKMFDRFRYNNAIQLLVDAHEKFFFIVFFLNDYLCFYIKNHLKNDTIFLSIIIIC